MATKKTATGKFLVDVSSLKPSKDMIDKLDAAIQKAVIGVITENATLRAEEGRGFIHMPPLDPGFPYGIIIHRPPFEKLISLIDKNQ